jgi:hypothetical protein
VSCISSLASEQSFLPELPAQIIYTSRHHKHRKRDAKQNTNIRQTSGIRHQTLLPFNANQPLHHVHARMPAVAAHAIAPRHAAVADEKLAAHPQLAPALAPHRPVLPPHLHHLPPRVALAQLAQRDRAPHAQQPVQPPARVREDGERRARVLAVGRYQSRVAQADDGDGRRHGQREVRVERDARREGPEVFLTRLVFSSVSSGDARTLVQITPQKKWRTKMISCCSPIARGPSYKLLNGREFPSASKIEMSPALSRAC